MSGTWTLTLLLPRRNKGSFFRLWGFLIWENSLCFVIWISSALLPSRLFQIYLCRTCDALLIQWTQFIHSAHFSISPSVPLSSKALLLGFVDQDCSCLNACSLFADLGSHHFPCLAVSLFPSVFFYFSSGFQLLIGITLPSVGCSSSSILFCTTVYSVLLLNLLAPTSCMKANK